MSRSFIGMDDDIVGTTMVGKDPVGTGVVIVGAPGMDGAVVMVGTAGAVAIAADIEGDQSIDTAGETAVGITAVTAAAAVWGSNQAADIEGAEVSVAAAVGTVVAGVGVAAVVGVMVVMAAVVEAEGIADTIAQIL